MSKRELAIAFILIMGILAPLIDIPSVEAGWPPQDQTISIVDTHDDRWITELGRHFDSPLVQILDPDSDLTSYLIFRGVEINFWEPLTNATLRLRTTSNQSFDDSSVTIYGMKVDELQTISVGASFILSVPYTTAYVTYNTSLFSGVGWHDIDVTAIVEELIRAHNWDGDGVTGTETGDAIGFVILGAKGSDPRWFQDYRSSIANSADLRIQWNHMPPLISPPPVFDWVEQYRNFTIWNSTTIFECNMSLIMADEDNSAEFYYTTYPRASANDTDYNRVAVNNDPSPGMGYADIVAQVGKNVIVLLDQGQIRLYHSQDGGTTWDSLNLNDQFTDLEPLTSNNEGSMSVDVNGTVHITWSTRTPTSPAAYVQVYSNFTVDNEGNFTFYDGFDEWNFEMTYENIEVDRYGRVHIAYSNATENVYYTMKSGGAWLDDELIYSTDPNRYISVDVADMPGVPYVSILFCRLQAGDNEHVYQTIRAPNGTLTTTQLSTPDANFPASAMDMDGNTTHAVWEFWTDPLGDPHIITRSFNFTTLSRPAQQIVSSTGQNHQRADVGIGDAGRAYFMWYRVGPSDYYGRRMFLNGTFDGSEERIVNLAALTGSGSIAPLGGITYNTTDYFITDVNGTIVETGLEDIEDAYDWIEEEMGADPLNPEPSGWEGTPPEFSRFSIRRYFLILGYFCVWGPIWFFCWRRPSGYYICGGALIMLMGFGLLLSVQYV